MTAHDAVKTKENITAVHNELTVLLQKIGADAKLSSKLSADVGVFDITVRLSVAVQLLDEYAEMLDTALRKTKLREVGDDDR